jgi:hypothetical protein
MKPSILFKNDGTIKRFGVSKENQETPIDLLIYIFIVCVFIIFFVNLTKLYFNKK